MPLSTVFIGIGMFAVVTAGLTVWGMRKSYFQKEKLANMLLSKSAEKVMHYLKKHDSISEKEMRDLVSGVQASEFGSKATAVVDGNRAFVQKLIEVMLHDGLIQASGHEKGRTLYSKRQK